MTNIKKTIHEAYTQLGKWVNEQPFWLQDAAWRIYSNKRIDDEQIKIYVEMCIAQSKNDAQPDYNHFDIRELECHKNNKNVAIVSLSEINGVNALADNASLEFSTKGITAIYGLNGAGKSGFMRIFKVLSGCPYEEPIYPNVFKKDSTIAPTCKVTVFQDGERKEEKYILTSKPNNTLLSACDVFDTRISNQYITSTNNVSYQPFVFTVLSELALTADRIGKYISSLEKGITERSLKCPDDFSHSNDLKWLASLSGDSTIPDDCLIWNEEKENEMEGLSKRLDSERVKQRLKAVMTMKNAITPIQKDINCMGATYSESGFDAAFHKLTEAKGRFEAAQCLFGDSANEQDKIAIKTDDWKNLWASAKRYYERFLFAENGNHFGEEGSICPLCHQQIKGEIQKRVSSVDQYINGSFSNEYQSAQREFHKLCEALTNRNITADTTITSLKDILSDDDLCRVFSVYKQIEALKTFKDDEQCYKAISQIKYASVKKLIDDKLKELDDEIRNLQDSLDDNKKSELQSRLSQLKAQKWAYDNKDSINRVISNLRQLSDLEKAKQYIKTNKITVQANKLADLLITQAYIERFTKELAQMAPGMKVKLEKAQSKKGKSPYKVSIDNGDGKKYRLEDILSEGEQRIVALAAFFADASGREDFTPIIIDDPISSLDLNYEDNATKRIVELAKKRQVIVFTHRISLLVGISEACKSNEVEMKEVHIRGAAKGKGIPDFKDIYRGNVKAQLNGLKGRLSQAKKMDEDSAEYRDCISRICQQFRICVERSVEDVLLLGIVRRFHRNIRTNGMVTKLAAIEKEDCEIVDKMMTKYSFIEHSQPSDVLTFQYTADEIESDIQQYIDWITEYSKKQKK